MTEAIATPATDTHAEIEAARDAVARAVAGMLARHVAEGTPLVAAVSGGADSVALAHGLARAVGDGVRGWPLAAVVFVDHGLRDVTAERDAAERTAREVGAPFVALAVTLAPGNLQARARHGRYAALVSEARARGALVATGHTRTDQAETVLSRVMRGAGVPGLAGLVPRRGRVVRPLLEVTRATTRACGWPFADDPSNTSPRFERNRVRSVLAALAAEAPALERRLAELAGHAAAATRLLDALALATPELALGGLDVETAHAHLVHLARAHGARGPERKAMRAWAEALTAGRRVAVSLGEGLRGLAREGRASVVPDEDPRRTVVAWRPGTYRGPAMSLSITEHVRDGHETNEVSLLDGTHLGVQAANVVAASDIVWPLTLRPAHPREVGAFSDTTDFDDGGAVGGWCVIDGAGRTLVPAPRRAATETAGSRTAGDDGRWIRIVLEPFARARASRVVGSAKGPLNKD